MAVLEKATAVSLLVTLVCWECSRQAQGQCHRGSVTAWGCCVPQSLGLSAVLWIPKFSSRESVDSTGAFPLEGSLTMPVLPGGADPKAFKTRRNSDESRHQRLIIPPNG